MNRLMASSVQMTGIGLLRICHMAGIIKHAARSRAQGNKAMSEFLRIVEIVLAIWAGGAVLGFIWGVARYFRRGPRP